MAVDQNLNQELAWAKAVKAYKQNNKALAVKLFLELADSGNYAAYKEIGNIYEYGGGGIAKDLVKARYWYELATGEYDPEGFLSLAKFYYFGLDVPVDYEKAHDLYYQISKTNNPVAYFVLGKMHHLGQGVERDIDKAIGYYNKSAKCGDVYAKRNLAIIQYKEQGKVIGLFKIFINSVAAYFINKKNANDERLRSY